MSAIYIVAGIIAVIGAIICYLFITQSLEKKRKQRERLIRALHQRAKVFRYILSGFPPNFLTKELTLLVQRCLTDVLQQLAQLEPKERSHVEEIAMVANLMQTTQQRPDDGKRPTLQSQAQVKDVKTHLQELYKFLMHLQKRGTIKKVEADDFGEQIKLLVLQISIDAYILQAKAAKQGDKPKLALHYFGLAKKLIEKDETGKFQTTLLKLNKIMAELEAVAAPDGALPTPDEEAGEDKAWDELKSQDSWKKKNVYDE
ncbi:hypothetical protein [Simiduia agarivorans]|uniref:Uncharacterized protein n=1 Tax=Simiduia agarivorans (strain DSM 21679 / JCM 13881 / BCRC 17597 / SA1) TaxID=1117647 RepID=K4KJ57_SIMAS|nr:hypothetical protein [Simiduia agarivorans]AFU98028.1 hypothetical protein M5M_04105 [Simiduia agarivorans SA1 = DSM 21679]